MSGTDLVEGVNTTRVCVTDSSSFTDFTNINITKDTTAPSVTLNQASGQADPAGTLPINFAVVFSEAIDPATFTTSDITHSGSATGITWTIINSGDNRNFTLRATIVTGAGTLIPSIPANAVMDPAGNGNTASTSSDKSVDYAPTTSSSVVISEFRTRGPDGGDDEFIELYNPTTSAVDISGWKINASNSSGGTSTRATIPASTILRSGQYYLIANSSSGGYSNTSVTADLTYGTGISNDGGIALLKPDNTIVDQVGMSSGSFYKEGATLIPLPSDTNQSYERKPGGDSGSCQDTNVNVDDFQNITSDPQNYSEPLRLCGVNQPAPVNTTTFITSDTPDPSLVNSSVTISVTVSVPGSTTTIATGKVDITITGSGTGCTLTLNSTGKGSCAVVFSTSGTKTITATYQGDNRFNKSSDTESHQVTTTATPVRTPTRTPTPLPPPPLLVINEFVPRPGHDWNNDGIVNVEDEYIEILNHGVVNVNLSGYSLDDEVNIGSTPYRLPSVVLRPGERVVFYGSETGLLLSDGGDGVRLLRPNGQLMDAYNYFVVGYPDQSFCRLPDNGGADDWNQNCFPTPGLQNSLSGNVPRPSAGRPEELYCPIADTLPEAFARAECDPYGNDIWRAEYWDRTGWYGKRYLPESNGRWPVFAD